MSGKALKYILKNPKDFFKNLGKGLFQGFKNFFKNIKTHLKNGLKGWLEMKLGGRINFPKKFNLRWIFSLILQILGLSFEVIKNVYAKVLGRNNLEAIFLFVKGDWKGDIKEKGPPIFPLSFLPFRLRESYGVTGQVFWLFKQRCSDVGSYAKHFNH